MVELATRRSPLVTNTQWLTPLKPATRLSFFGGPEAQAAAFGAWGAEFSQAACRAHVNGPRATLWLGPGEYLLLDSSTAGPSSASLFALLESSIGGLPHALVDVSHRQFALEISGPQAPTILSGACPLDLDLATFPIGMCTRTVLAKADIVLWRTREDAFHVEVWRSFAGYVGGVLKEIASEFFPAG